MDLGPWLVSRDVSIVSTVPTLASLWPAEALEAVRLLIFGGEACPPELAERLAVEGREVWNTYGPTEATVVACGALMDGKSPVSIGLPLDGWDLAVVDAQSNPVAVGEVGEPKASPALLMEMMEVREELSDAKRAKDLGRVARLAEGMRAREAEVVAGLGRSFAAAGADVEKIKAVLPALGELRYLRRFLDEVSAIEEELAT